MHELGVGPSGNVSSASILQQLLHGVGGGAAAAPLAGPISTPFLGVLDSDMLEEEDEDDGHRTSVPPDRSAGEAVGSRLAASTSAVAWPSARSDTSTAFVLDALPPRRPVRRERHTVMSHTSDGVDSSAHAADASEAQGTAAMASDGDEHLRRLLGSGDYGHDLVHGGLRNEGVPGGAHHRQQYLPRQTPAIPRAVPGWTAKGTAPAVGPSERTIQRQRHAAPQPNVRYLRPEDDTAAGPTSPAGQAMPPEPAGGNDAAAIEDGQPVAETQRSGDSNLAVGVVDDRDSGDAAMAIDEQPAERDARVGGGIVPPDAALPLAVEAAGVRPHADTEELHHQETAPAEVAELCTDAHTVVWATVASRPSDALVWQGLCQRAINVVQEVHTLYKHHPQAPSYQGPLLSTPDQDIAAYEAAVRMKACCCFAVLLCTFER